MHRFFAFLRFGVGASLFAPFAANACLPVPPSGIIVRTAKESALIIWDKDNGVEHFVRRAKFDTNAANLGFLVPTPAWPALHEVNPNLFAELQNPMRRETLHLEDDRPEFYSLLYWLLVTRLAPPRVMVGGGERKEMSPAQSQVAVLSEQEVGGYQATIFRAEDATALNRWLDRNGYPSNAVVTEWLRPYVEKGWIITAFKVSRKGKNPVARPLGLASVRMSFATPRPFYPYREPQTTSAHAAPPPRSLRLFLLADKERMAATLGENGPEWGTENVQNLYAQSSSEGADPSAIPGHVGVEWAGAPTPPFFAPNVRDYAGLPATTWMPGHLTVFLDTQSPRPGVDEIYFAPAADQSDIKPEPIREYARIPIFSVPLEILLLSRFSAPSGNAEENPFRERPISRTHCRHRAIGIVRTLSAGSDFVNHKTRSSSMMAVSPHWRER